MKLKSLLAALFVASGACAHAAGVDPLAATIDARDALRFARLMPADALPTADTLQRDYLDGATSAIAVFTPIRIVNAQHLAKAIASNPESYRYAIRECLPRLPALQADLRAIYLAYAGLLPERPLPAIEVVFGAGNSGGTASQDAQVLGLEVTCPPGTTFDQFRTSMRGFFAHETVHTWQPDNEAAEHADPMLRAALVEGVADYLATLVTGEIPHLARDAWARPREEWLWHEFQADRQAMLADAASRQNASASPRFTRWFANCGPKPGDWPCEAGYWVGMRIAESYVAHSADKHAAIRELIELRDQDAILKASGYDR